jgi:hypothetical protein
MRRWPLQSSLNLIITLWTLPSTILMIREFSEDEILPIPMFLWYRLQRRSRLAKCLVKHIRSKRSVCEFLGTTDGMESNSNLTYAAVSRFHI